MDKALIKTLISMACAVIIVILIYGYATIKNNPESNSHIFESWTEKEAFVSGSETIMGEKWLNIEYSYDGIDYKTKIEALENSDIQGDTIMVFCNPDNPKEVAIKK